MSIEAVKVTGLRELQAGLKQMDGESQKQLRVVLNEVADGIVKGAQPLVPRRSGAAAASIRAGSSQRLAQVKAGNASAPYYAWLDFGGRVGRNHSVSRPFLAKGRYIWATFDAQKGSVQTKITDGLSKLAKDAGFEVR